MSARKSAKKYRGSSKKRQARRRPAAQPKTAAPSLQARQATSNPGNMRPADVLQLQRAIGNRATGRRLAGNMQRQPNGKVNGLPVPAATIQLTPEKTVVKGITHLVKMSGKTLLGGQEGKALWDGDVVVIDSSDHKKSRRGIEAETSKELYSDKGHDYEWFRALKVNGRDVSGEKFYVRDEMLDRLARSEEAPALEAAKENEATRDMLEETVLSAGRAADLGQTARDLLRRLGQIVNLVPDNPRFDKSQALGQIGQARDELQANIIAQAGRTARSADAELSSPTQNQRRAGQLFTAAKAKEKEGLAALAAIEKQTVAHGRPLFSLVKSVEGGLPIWSEVVHIGDEAHEERVGGAAEANERFTNLSSSIKEKASTVWGYFNNLFDAFGIFAASLAALTAITAVGIIVGITGYVLGGIAAVAAFAFAEKTAIKERQLAKIKDRLEQGQVDQDLVELADYARKQKRKKKRRQRAVGAAGLTVATLALIGIAGGGVGIAMAVLAASIGLGFLGYKAWRKWRGKKKAMHELVGGAAAGDQEKIATLTKMGVTTNELAGLGDKATKKGVERKVEQGLKDKRVDSANQLVDYARFGKPSEKLSAEKIIAALGLDVQKVAGEGDWSQEKAVSKVASKLASW